MNGAIRWMISNGVTANLLMVFILIAGAFGAISLRKQVFPEFSPDIVNISVAYPGATPVMPYESFWFAMMTLETWIPWRLSYSGIGSPCTKS